MNLTFALLFNLCISLLSCQSIKNVKVDPDKDIYRKQLSPAEINDRNIYLKKMNFLKVPPINKELKNVIDVQTLEPKTENHLKSVPFAVLDEPIEEVLYLIEPELNTGDKKDNIEVNEELLLNNSQKEDKRHNGVVLEQVSTEDNDADTREVITNTSKDDKKNEEALHHKEEMKPNQHTEVELQNDLKSPTICNPELCKEGIQHDSGYKSGLNVNEDDSKISPISIVLNKYVFG